MKVPFSYLDRQFADVDDYLQDVRALVKSGGFTLGKPLQEFEAGFAKRVGMPHAIGGGKGTDAVIMPLKISGIGPGDEGIPPTKNFFATLRGILGARAKPPFGFSENG